LSRYASPYSTPESSPYTIGGASIGWGIAGASAVADARGVAAIRSQPLLAAPAARGGRSQVAGAWVQAIFSHNPGRARLFADRHAIPHVATTLEEMLARPEIRCIYVANHPRHHAETVSAALQAGKHVLCEPPLALTFAEAESLALTAANRGLVLAVNHQRRAEPAVRRARALLELGELGDLMGARAVNAAVLPYAQQTWRLQPPWGGVLLDKCTHTFDLLHFLCGERIADMQAVGGLRLLGSEVAEEVFCAARLARSGLPVHTHDSFLTHHLPTAVELHGSHASAVVQDAFAPALRPARATLLVVRNGAGRIVELDAVEQRVDPFAESVGAVQAAVRGGGRPLATAGDGLASLAAALAAQDALRRGARVQAARVVDP
jgi:1,5-anhydro-D-fructose reductase (1,5-anhydro-D-mannitol-forming)